jgi:hypothetical protein
MFNIIVIFYYIFSKLVRIMMYKFAQMINMCAVLMNKVVREYKQRKMKKI